MIDDVSDIADMYNRDTQKEVLRLDEHQLEHDLTWRYLETYLPLAGSILEIGAAAGRYTLELARQGYTVTAVDMSAELLGICRQRLGKANLAERVQLFEADARDLSSVVGKDFDAVLLMGPLYHLVLESDRQLALEQACQRLRPGGLLFSAFISRLGIFGEGIKEWPDWIEKRKEVRSILDHGWNPENLREGNFRGYFATVSEIAPLHEAAGLETVLLAGVEPAVSADDESYNRLEGEQRRLWLDLLFEISTESSILGASRHLLYIGRQPE